ncbi:MAG: deoxyribodipyrimidine photolyase [Planctomycetota bacterium]
MNSQDFIGGVPESRVLPVAGAGRDRTIRPGGDFVLYWMTANRRASWNYSLDRAADGAAELGKPLLVLEALRCDYPWASERLHRFVLDGMACNAADFDHAGVAYYPYVERSPGAGAGLLRALARQACVVVSDDYPCFFLPAVVRAARQQIDVRFELVDSNGIYPMRSTDRLFSRAHDFRRHLQKSIQPHLIESPRDDCVAAGGKRAEVPAEVARRWPAASIGSAKQLLADLPLPHRVPWTGQEGGSRAARAALSEFVNRRMPSYEERNQPEREVASGLSPYLHFGHVSAHEVFAQAAARDGWDPGKLAEKATGSSSGWWGGSAPFESFLDELITWRELGFNRCALTRDFDKYESLPAWAQQTLADHAGDPRAHVYTLAEFEQAGTHDRLWNAAQRQLTTEGRIHNYLRMLWGKKILEWSATPRDALGVMLELNNKYALDGRDPNSYSGIFWVLGRYDRAWGPERTVYGKIRYMSSDNTARKVRVKDYVARYNVADRRLFE